MRNVDICHRFLLSIQPLLSVHIPHLCPHVFFVVVVIIPKVVNTFLPFCCRDFSYHFFIAFSILKFEQHYDIGTPLGEMSATSKHVKVEGEAPDHRYTELLIVFIIYFICNLISSHGRCFDPFTSQVIHLLPS